MTDAAFVALCASRSLKQVTHALGGRNRGPDRHKVRERANQTHATFGTNLPPHTGAWFRLYTRDEPCRWNTIRNKFIKERGCKCSYHGCAATTQIEVHHRDCNCLNNRRSNLQILCSMHHNLIEGKMITLNSTDRQDFIRISDDPNHLRPGGRRNWKSIIAALAKCDSKDLKSLSKLKSDALSSRRTSYEPTGANTKTITITRSDGLAIVAFLHRTGITATAANLAEIRSLMSLEAAGFNIVADSPEALAI